MTPVPITTEADLTREMRELVEWLMTHSENPRYWPLEDKERIYFVRDAITRAKSIRDSGPFLRGNLVRAVAEFKASSTRTQAEPRKRGKVARETGKK